MKCKVNNKTPERRHKTENFATITTQLTFTCLKLTIETPEKGVKYVPS